MTKQPLEDTLLIVRAEGREQGAGSTGPEGTLLLPFRWPEQVTWPSLQPLGWRNRTFPQEGGREYLNKNTSLVHESLCLTGHTPDGRGHLLCCCLRLPWHTPPQENRPAAPPSGLCSDAAFPGRPSLTTSYFPSPFFSSSYFQTVQPKPTGTCTHVRVRGYTHTYIPREKVNAGKKPTPKTDQSG